MQMPTSRPFPGQVNGCNLAPYYNLSAWLIILLTLFLGGCTSSKLAAARQEFHAGHPARAYDILSEVKSYPSKDKLLFHMEKGVILFSLGKYQESTAEFLIAARLKNEQEIINIARQTGSLVTTEWLTNYKGEYGERLWIHTYLMMNFLLQANYEDALVEAKQALKLYKEYPEVLSEAHFTRTLIAICYELLWDYDDAYIEYKKLFDQLPNKKDIAGDLYYLANRLRYTNELDRYTTYLTKEEQDFWLQDQETEIIVFAELGRAPEKIPGNIIVPPSIRFSFPQYRNTRGKGYSLELLQPEMGNKTSKTATKVRKVLVASLKARAKSMVAKEATRVTIKETLAQAVEENNKAAGALVRAAFFFSEEADTRGWETLPAGFALLRIRLQPGVHDIAVGIKNNNGTTIGEIDVPRVELTAGQKFFTAIRWPLVKSKRNDPLRKPGGA